MTKEEQLKQEAKKSCIDKTHYCIGGFGGDAYCEGYIDSAEPREKRIAELELKIKHITQHLEPQAMTALFEQVEEEVKQEQRIKKLEEENTELKKQQFSLRNERNTFLAQNEQYEKDLIDFNVNLTKAKEIIQKLQALYFSPVVTNEDVKRQDEILAEAEEYRESITQRLFNEDDIESAWQRGAEFGYNKANEWHSYAERPKEKLNALCFDIGQNRFILGYYDIESDEWIKYSGYEIITIDLWKKIVPPGLPKEIG